MTRPQTEAVVDAGCVPGGHRTEAVEILQKCGQTFEFPVSWGTDLQSEHERYLTEKHFRRPVILFDYPRTLKPFYMRVNSDEQTVAAFDAGCQTSPHAHAGEFPHTTSSLSAVRCIRQHIWEKIISCSFRHCAIISYPKDQRRRMLG